MTNKNIQYCFGIILILITNILFSSYILAKQPNQNKKDAKLIINTKTYFKQSIPIICISASSDYEYGLKEGTLLHDYYSSIVKLAKRLFNRVMEQEKPNVLQHIETLKLYYPSFLEQMEGIAKALEVSIADIISAEILLNSLALRVGGCTNTGVSSKVTRCNQTYVSWNIDLRYIYKIFLSCYIKKPPIIICDIIGKYKYVKFSILPMTFSFGLINEKGLSFAGSTVTTTEKGNGLTSLELNHLAMETCATVEEVKDLYQKSERESGMNDITNLNGITSNLNTIWADAKGDVQIIEYTHTKITTKKDVILAETNHYQFLNVSQNISQDSRIRLERSYELLYKYNDLVDDNFYKKILTCDHEKGLYGVRPDPSDICRHGGTYGTVCVIITMPNRLAIYYCPGHPCACHFKYLDFSLELIGNKNSKLLKS